jgi:hypothetical protein
MQEQASQQEAHKMQVCDRCHEAKQIIAKIKIKGKEFELCSECADATANYIKFSYKEPKGLEKLGELFKG